MRTLKYYIDEDNDIWIEDQNTGEISCNDQEGVFSDYIKLEHDWKKEYNAQQITEEEAFLEML